MEQKPNADEEDSALKKVQKVFLRKGKGGKKKRGIK